MFRRTFLKQLGLTSASLMAPQLVWGQNARPPNIVVILLDDAGWGDFAPFGNPAYPTSHVQQLAQEGTSFKHFYVPQAICSASRAALLTGCYPGRTGVTGAFYPGDRGLERDHPILSEILKTRGYQTGCFGKWHLGDQKGTRPHDRGFDESAGLMYSNDMWKRNKASTRFEDHPLSYWEDGKIRIKEIQPDHQKRLTQWGTERSVEFIKKNKDRPFFLYVPYSMPHVPLFCSDAFEGKSGKGLYADVMMELDASIGRINQTLKEEGLEDNTMVVFTSDNGPWTAYGNHAGTTPFREAKATSFDGGKRCACVIKYPNHIKTDHDSNHTFCSIDLAPTIASLAGASLSETAVDGKNLFPYLCHEEGASNPHEYYALSMYKRMEAVVSSDGRWKLHLPHQYRSVKKVGNDGERGTFNKKKKIKLSLFDLKNDPGEKRNVLSQNRKVADKMRAFATAHQKRFYPPNS